jgi:hypothetical protein
MQIQTRTENSDETDDLDLATAIAQNAAAKAKAEASYNWMSEAELAAHFAEFPDANPHTNPGLMAALNMEGYIDRGLNGPLGGVGGTPSIDSQMEIRHIEGGGHSEMSLTTFTVDGKTMTMAELQAHEADEEEGRQSMAQAIAEEDAERRAIHAALAAAANPD